MRVNAWMHTQKQKAPFSRDSTPQVLTASPIPALVHLDGDLPLERKFELQRSTRHPGMARREAARHGTARSSLPHQDFKASGIE